MSRNFRFTRTVPVAVFLAAAAFAAAPASAHFHLMQIEQVIGDVCGDTTQQAVQLRMRAAGQNVVNESRLRAWDAAGANPLMIIDMGADVAISAAGSRVLITSANFAAVQGITPDFLMSNLIPPASLAAGRLTFEEDATSVIYWSLAWGGANYTGSNTGNTANDSDGNFGPAFGSALPFAQSRSLAFGGAANAPSTSNSANYAASAGPATFTTNGGASVTLDCFMFSDGFESGNTATWSAVSP